MPLYSVTVSWARWPVKRRDGNRAGGCSGRLVSGWASTPPSSAYAFFGSLIVYPVMGWDSMYAAWGLSSLKALLSCS